MESNIEGQWKFTCGLHKSILQARILSHTPMHDQIQAHTHTPRTWIVIIVRLEYASLKWNAFANKAMKAPQCIISRSSKSGLSCNLRKRQREFDKYLHQIDLRISACLP